MRKEEAMITWSEIEAQAGDYRDGFVAVFKEHEGKETDERDGNGRIVKVSQSSFARHMHIPESTFHDWVRAIVRSPDDRSEAQRVEQDARRARSAANRLTSDDKKELIRNLLLDFTDEEREDLAFEITSEASRERQQEYARQAKANQAAEKPFDLELISYATKAKKRLQTLAQKLSHHGLSPEAKEVLSAEITAIHEILALIQSALHAPSMDEELAALLKAGS